MDGFGMRVVEIRCERLAMLCHEEKEVCEC